MHALLGIALLHSLTGIHLLLHALLWIALLHALARVHLLLHPLLHAHTGSAHSGNAAYGSHTVTHAHAGIRYRRTRITHLQ